jgi:uncharacterized protein with HEPN domain
MKDDQLYLIHTRECIERMESYIRGKSKQDFIASELLQDDVVRNLQVMTESTQHLSDKTKEDERGIDWFKIAGFRNVLVNDYWGLDIERVWNILEKDLPAPKKAIGSMLE